MYGMFGFAEKLNIQNYKFNGKLFTLYMYERSGFAKKIEYPELRKFIGKLCTLYMYVTSGFAKN